MLINAGWFLAGEWIRAQRLETTQTLSLSLGLNMPCMLRYSRLGKLEGEHNSLQRKLLSRPRTNRAHIHTPRSTIVIVASRPRLQWFMSCTQHPKQQRMFWRHSGTVGGAHLFQKSLEMPMTSLASGNALSPFLRRTCSVQFVSYCCSPAFWYMESDTPFFHCCIASNLLAICPYERGSVNTNDGGCGGP